MSTFIHNVTVTEDHLDGNGHVNNVVYVRWMQETANTHSDTLGALELVRTLGTFWVVRSHHIEYKKQTFLEDQLAIHTWIDGFLRVRTTRCFRFERGNEVVATGKTEYVLLDVETHKPQAIPTEVIQLYES